MAEAWSADAGAVLEAQGVAPLQGLGEQEARRRLDRHGANRLHGTGRRGVLAILLDQFRSLVFGLLLLAAVLSAVVGEFVQAGAIAAAIAINVAIGFVTELRAARSMEALRRLDRNTATVRRGGEAREIAATGLVPGDIVLLSGGEVVPADMRLVESEDLTIDESALTGESVPVSKGPAPVAADAPLAGRSSMAFKGTAVLQGEAAGVVTATGMETELGRIAALAEAAEAGQTPLETRLDRLAERLLAVIVAVAALVSLAGIVAGRDMLLMIETGVALVVAAVPEGLPIVASLALARGMLRLARRNALVKRLSAVETLGATNVICSDKTGTLTQNRMVLGRILLADGGIAVAQDPDSPLFARDGAAVEPGAHAALERALRIAVLCNDAALAEEGEATGDPLEIALLEAGRRAGLDRGGLLERFPERREAPFDPETRRMATWHDAPEGILLAVKGAPEALIAAATAEIGADGEAREIGEEARGRWREANERLAREGLRTLALATRQAEDSEPPADRDLALVGLVGLIDPPRSEVRPAVLECRRAGIRAVMVTGDQPETARAVAAEVGLVDDAAAARVVLGSEMEDAGALPEAERAALLEAPIFARFSPAQKLDLIDLYQETGLVVAMTGDGVNDAPALKSADIGVAMGRGGTKVARDAADMVLRDNSFASIVNAVAEGRKIFANIRKFVVYMLSGNIAEILAVSILAVMNAPLPLLPLQILFINIVSDVFPALALGLGESGGDVMRRPPRDPGEPLLTRRLWGAIGGYGALLAASVMAAFGGAFALGMDEAEAVTVSFLSFGFARLWHVFNMRDPGGALLRNEVTRNPWVWGALAIGIVLLLAAAWLPPLAAVLGTVPPGPEGWALIAAGSLAPLVLGQLVKLWRGRRGEGAS